MQRTLGAGIFSAVIGGCCNDRCLIAGIIDGQQPALGRARQPHKGSMGSRSVQLACRLRPCIVKQSNVVPQSQHLVAGRAAAASAVDSHSNAQDGEWQQANAAKAHDALCHLLQRARWEAVASSGHLLAGQTAGVPAICHGFNLAHAPPGHASPHDGRLPLQPPSTHQGIQARQLQQLLIRHSEHRDEPAPQMPVASQLHLGRPLLGRHLRRHQPVVVHAEPGVVGMMGWLRVGCL